MEQYWQSAVASGFQILPPAKSRNGEIYSPQVWPEGGLKDVSSVREHSTTEFATAVASMPLTRYVNGETRYMKIQKCGRLSFVAKTLERDKVSCCGRKKNTRYQIAYPQNMIDMMNSKFPRLLPSSAVSIPAIIICVNVDTNMKNAQSSKNIRAPRSVVESVA